MSDDSRLGAAFRSADYCVEHDGETRILNIGLPAPPALAAWIERHNGRRPAWLITAYNPGGEPRDDAANRAHAWVLTETLERCAIRRLSATNRDPAGNWPDEPGWLVAGLEEGRARHLARRFGQAAIVAVRATQVDLLWCTP